jgi:hypothetical protein
MGSAQSITNSVDEITRGLVARLSSFTGGGPAHYMATKQFAESLGLGRLVNIRVLPGENRVRGSDIVREIFEGMGVDVRFEAFVNNAHAMAIVGADLATSSIWVSDSMHGGALRKLRIPGDAHIDALIAVVRKDQEAGSRWLASL